MTDELENYTTDQLLAELVHRTTFAGIIVRHTGSATQGQLRPGHPELIKSAPLTRAGVEELLRAGQSLVPQMFKNG